MVKRVVFISNPRSSNHRKVAGRVTRPIKHVAGELVEYEIIHTFFEDNVERISALLCDGDLVIAAGGDGTAAITANAIIKSQRKDISLGALPYGNFNDLATAFSGRHGKAEQLLGAKKTVAFHPVDITMNGKHFRYSLMYADIGLVAGAVDEFEKGPERQRLRHGWSNQLLSFLALIPYYFKHKRRYKLPKSSLGDKKVTDFFAINGSRMAKFNICRGFTDMTRFGVVALDTSKLLPCIPFTIRSIRGYMPLEVVDKREIVFEKPADLDFQSDGEYRKLKGVKTLAFSKSSQHINVIKL